MRKVALVGAGVSKFGVRKASYRDLIWEAGKACFDSVPGVKPRDVEGLVVGSVMPERTAFQSHISPMAAEVFAQLRDEAGPRQVANARIGLTHNNSGMGEHVVMIYGRDAA